MADLRLLANAHMRALIGRLGCLDAAAATIQARTGIPTGKGTLSKRVSGQLGWPIEEIAAIEDALGDYPVTRMLMARATGSERGPALPLTVAAGSIAKETGEAIAATLAGAGSCDGGEYAVALVELGEAREAIEAAERALRHLMAGGNP